MLEIGSYSERQLLVQKRPNLTFMTRPSFMAILAIIATVHCSESFALAYRAIIQWIECRWQLTLDEKPST